MDQTRREFLRHVGFLSTIVALPVMAKVKNRPVKKPNILFILLDDLGKEWVSCYGAKDIDTPHIDRLAESGIQFSNCYSMPQCTPSRVSLMTGQYPFRHGWVNHWDVPRWGGGCFFDPEKNPSVARILKSGGYTTAIAGKWQVNDFRVQPNVLQQHGFDDYCMWTGYETGNSASAERYWNPYVHTKAGSKTYEGRFGEDVFSDFLIHFMKKNKDKPMFLYYPMCLPHTPFTSTPLETDVKEKYECHKAMVSYTDFILGKLVTALDELGLRENTIIFWTTDNGTTGSITGTLLNRKIKGGKSKTSESGTCAPFIVNCPGLVPKGAKTDALTDFTDFLPTCTDLAGVKIPHQTTIDGVSIANVILGQATDSERQWILSMGGKNNARLTDKGVENQYVFRDRVIRDKRFKLVINTKRQPEKLVDLLVDPDENVNLIDSKDPDVVRAIKRFMQVIHTMPHQDNDPIYTPLAKQPWDVQVTAKSQGWKK